MSDEITDRSAASIAAAIRNREFSASEVTAAFIGRMETLNPLVNAICTPNPTALDDARACDVRLAAGADPRALEGVPFVVKDNLRTRGLLTTFGSKIYQNYIPDEDSVSVERLKAAGAILLGKTNTPEFARDINTTNFLFGTTRNPRDLNRSSGGSSGGTAAAIASGMAPIGLGTDLGGSLRIPAAFCGITAIRPVPGRVPAYPTEFGWDTLVQEVQGPMARTVGDLGLALSVLAGPDDRDPSSIPLQGYDYVESAKGGVNLAGRRVAFSPDLNGLVPVDVEVAALVRDAVDRLEMLGCDVEQDCFDTSDIAEIRAGTRAFGLLARYAEYAGRDSLTLAFARQIAESEHADLHSVARAERLRTAYWHRVRLFLQKYDYIVTPTVGATAFRLDQPLPTMACQGHAASFRETFLFTYAFSITGLPAASIPCGFTSDGLPVGLQIVGRRLREDTVLEALSALSGTLTMCSSLPFINLDSIRWMTPEPLADFP